jgi:hypothetical protein
MSELKRLPEGGDKISNFQKKYNVGSKSFVYLLGKNITLFAAMLIPIMLVGFIWTDFGEVVISTKMISDGIVTVLLFVTGEMLMTRLGADGGKLDAEYIESKKEYEGLVTRVSEIGTMFMGVFCDWQIDVEMEQAIFYRLRLLRMTTKEYEAVKDLPQEELESKYGRRKAAKIIEINNLKPIDLNEAILLYNGEKTVRGGVPESADGYLRSRRHVIETIIACLFTGLLTVSVVLSMTTDVSFARVLYTVFKLVMLLFRMAKGYDRGARAYNTIEVRQHKAKCIYLRLYERFVQDKTYLKLGDKYGDISCYIDNEIPTNNEIPLLTNEE